MSSKIDLVIVNPSGDATQWAEVGVKKVCVTSYEGTLESHDRVLVYRPPGGVGIEHRGPYQAQSYGEPLSSVANGAHAVGVEVHPYSLVAVAGVWMGSRRAQPQTRLSLAPLPRFAYDHPEYMSRAQDGRSWTDWEIGERVLGYDIGYMGLAYPEVRQYETSAHTEYVTDYDADGIQMEFVPVLADGEDTWPLGYDTPALEAFHTTRGVDPRTLANTDEDWTRFRAGYYSQFVKELRDAMEATNRQVEISVAAGGVWADPEGAYKLMVDWPTWVDEGLVDALHPKFSIIDPHYPLSYPATETGSWLVTPERINEEVRRVKQTVGDRCLTYGIVQCKNGGGGIPMPELTQLLLESARAIMDAGADGFGVYPDGHVMEHDEFWACLAKIHDGDF